MTTKKTFPHAQNVHSRLKFSFSFWNFHSRLKISIPNPVFFSVAREGPGMKKTFSIENFIPYWKLDFFNVASRDWFFQSWGPPGLKKFKIASGIEIFKRDWEFQASLRPKPYFCGKFWRSRLKISIEIENFKRDLFFSIFGPLADPGCLSCLCLRLSGTKKEPQSQTTARTVPKNFLNNSGGVTGHCPSKQGFWGKSHQKVHPKVRRNLCRKSSLGYLFCPFVILVVFVISVVIVKGHLHANHKPYV